MTKTILAWDTATEVTAAALVSFDEKGGPLVIDQYLGELGETHSRKLMPALTAMLDKARLNLSDIDFLAVGLGPGSFTGLRVGLATAKGLSWGAGRPLKGLSSLDILAWQSAVKNRLLVPVIDARHQQLFAAFYKYDADGQLERLTDHLALFTADLEREIKVQAARTGCEPLLMGPGADLLAGAGEVIEALQVPCMLTLAKLAYAGKVPEAGANPIYARPPAIWANNKI